MTKPWQISRRHLLRGAGTAVALPLLEQMLPSPARAQSAASARRMLALFMPCGVNLATWKPATTGTGYTLPPALQPLAPVKSDVLVLTNLANRPAKATTAGEHPSGTGSFLTAVPCATGSALGNAVSVDQVAARALRQYTRIPSLELGPPNMSGASGDCQGYSCTYMYNISWVSPTTPAAREVSPAAVFDRLFAAGANTTTGPSAAQLRQRLRLSVLDAVRQDTQTVQNRLGVSDKRKLEEYLTGVRELEQRIQALSAVPQAACAFAARPSVAASDIPNYVRAMLDLIVLAFQCDLTRVASLMMKAGGDRNDYAFPFLGISEPHHPLSHHQNNTATLAKLTRIDAWHVEQFAYVLGKLKAIQEPDGTVLDNSVVFMSSEVGDGDRHTHDDLPVLLGGRGGGSIVSGRHVRFETAQPIANLFTSMLNAVGVPIATFGADGTGPLAL